jgi:hypothetical protein
MRPKAAAAIATILPVISIRRDIHKMAVMCSTMFLEG